MNNESKSSQMLVFEERGNRSIRRKPLGAEKRTNKLNPHMTPSPGIEPGPHWWEASALTTAPSLHPKQQRVVEHTLSVIQNAKKSGFKLTSNYNHVKIKGRVFQRISFS